MAIACGLGAGYLDVAIIVFKKVCWNPEGYYRIARDFPWSVPVGHAVLMTIAGVVVAAACLVRPGIVSTRAGSWLFATLAIWAALLRMPLYAVGSLLLAAGLGRVIVDAIAARGGPDSRRVRQRPAGARRRAGRAGGRVVGSGGVPRVPGGGPVAVDDGAGPQRRVDRLGHRPLLQPGPLRVWPEHLAQPGAVRGQGHRLRLRHGSRPVDLSLAQLLLHRPVADEDQHPVEDEARHPGSDPGRVPGLAGLSDRRVRGQYQLLHL